MIGSGVQNRREYLMLSLNFAASGIVPEVMLCLGFLYLLLVILSEESLRKNRQALIDLNYELLAIISREMNF